MPEIPFHCSQALGDGVGVADALVNQGAGAPSGA